MEKDATSILSTWRSRYPIASLTPVWPCSPTKARPGVTVRSVEGRAGVPHGSVRHHFGGLDGLRNALVDGLLARESPRDEPVEDVVRRWLGPDATIARARYELMLMASRDEALRAKVLQGRQVFIDQLEPSAWPPLRRGRW